MLNDVRVVSSQEMTQSKTEWRELPDGEIMNERQYITLTNIADGCWSGEGRSVYKITGCRDADGLAAHFDGLFGGSIPPAATMAF